MEESPIVKIYICFGTAGTVENEVSDTALKNMPSGIRGVTPYPSLAACLMFQGFYRVSQSI